MTHGEELARVRGERGEQEADVEDCSTTGKGISLWQNGSGSARKGSEISLTPGMPVRVPRSVRQSTIGSEKRST